MKILYIIPYVPFPLNSGGNQAFFNMVDVARKQHDISILLYVHDEKQEEDANELKRIWNNVTFYLHKEGANEPDEKQVPVKQNKMPKFYEWQCRFFEYFQHSMERKIARRQRKFANPNQWFENFEIGSFIRKNSVLFAKNQDLNNDFLNDVYQISRKGFDLIQIEFYEYLPLIYVLPTNVQTTFVHHELRFVRNENELELFDKVEPADRLLFEQQKELELAMLAKYDHIIVLTDIDKGILSQYLPQKHIYVSPALTSAGKVQEHKTFQPSRDLVFVGGGDHFPNADGIIWFCKEVFPLLKQKSVLPKVFVVGKWGEGIQNLIHYICPEIIFTGFVDDLNTFLNGKISIVPIRIGSGMRMKILDTISATAPLVTTSKGCEGLPFVNQQDCLIADSAEAFADNIDNLTKHVELQKQLTTSASHKLDGLLDGKALLEKRLNFYTQIEYDKP